MTSNTILIVRNLGGTKMAELDPVLKPQDAEKILSSIQEWMIEQAANPTNPTEDIDKSEARKETPPSASSVSPEPSVESSSCVPLGGPFEPSQEGKGSRVASNELFVRAGLVRTVVVVLLIAFVVGVAWYIYRDTQTRSLITASVNWLTSSFGANQRKSTISAQSSIEPSEQIKTPTVTPVPANEIAKLKQQVLALTNDLAVMRQDFEQLSGKQDQMSRDIATVQATEQNVSEKISSLTQLPPPQGQARKSVPRLVRAEAPKRPDAAPVPPKTSRQSDAASVPPTTSQTGTASLTEQPPRPPLPVPAVAETPSLPQ
jgi:hypothetical protein